MSKKMFSVIIPTFNNNQYLLPCVNSLYQSMILRQVGEIIIVNNGDEGLAKHYKDTRGVKVIEAGKNLGWEGGLAEGLKHSDADFVCFLNDDTFFPHCSSTLFFQNTFSLFCDPKVGAVGPVTTCASGCQSIFHPHTPGLFPWDVNWLIFFCVMIRRKALDEAGGVRTDLPGGDDFDLCWRLIKAGYSLKVNPSTFVIHHGFKTGERVYGGPSTRLGWNSIEMEEKTNIHLIREHGLKWFATHMYPQIRECPVFDFSIDREVDRIRAMVNGEQKILEVGCGNKKLFERSIGIDKIDGGDEIDTIEGTKSAADLTLDVSKPLPFEDNSQDIVIAKHVLEHCVDAVGALKEWKRVLKPGGRLIIAVPNQDIIDSVPMNPEHVHAFTPSTLKGLLELLGLEQEETMDSGNDMGFISRFRKI